jgi:hypothetical protein
MHPTLTEINLDSQGFRWFYLFAHSLAVLSILGAFILGIQQKKKSLVGFQVSQVLDYAFRIFLISGVILCLYGLWDFVFLGYWQPDRYWSNDHILGYVISYLFTGVIGIPVVWVIIKLIWRISLVRIIAKADSLISKIPFLPEKTGSDGLVIEQATYGTAKNKYDVTHILTGMILNDKLNVIASNSLAGDPEPGSPKMLIATYRYHGVQQTRVAMESYELKLPPDDHPA